MSMCLFIWKKPSFGFISLHFLNHILIGSFSRHHFPPENENLTIVHRETLKLIQLNKITQHLCVEWIHTETPTRPLPTLYLLSEAEFLSRFRSNDVLEIVHSFHFSWKCSLKIIDVFLREWLTI